MTSALTRTAQRDRVAQCAVDLYALPQPLVLGCSGGADSLALLALCTYVDVPVHVVYVDHGMRADTGNDIAIVSDAALHCGQSVEVVAVEVMRGANLEARMRAARYAALRAAAARINARGVAVAHTADDQAETVLLNMLRGAAAAGLAGMAAVRDDIYRPLLAIRRCDTEAVCEEMGWDPVQDSTNDDDTYLRNRVRHEVLPLLNNAASRDLVPVLARQAELLRTEHEFLDALAVAAWPGSDDDADRPRVAPLVELPLVLARRAVRTWLGSPPASLDDVDAVLRVVRGERVAVELAGRGRIARSQGRISKPTGM